MLKLKFRKKGYGRHKKDIKRIARKASLKREDTRAIKLGLTEASYVKNFETR